LDEPELEAFLSCDFAARFSSLETLVCVFSPEEERNLEFYMKELLVKVSCSGLLAFSQGLKVSMEPRETFRADFDMLGLRICLAKHICGIYFALLLNLLFLLGACAGYPILYVLSISSASGSS